MNNNDNEIIYRYLITGGGTAGHVYPALALADQIKTNEPTAQFLYVGTKNGAEERIVPAKGYSLLTLTVKGLPSKKNPFQWFKAIGILTVAAAKAIKILVNYKPHVIIGTGGYASAPILLSARLLKSLGIWKGILSLHEQNIIPGRFNQWMAGWVDFIGTSFPDTLRFLLRQNSFWTGYTLRKELERSHAKDEAARNKAKGQLGLPPSAKVLLVFGGSSGARTINQAILKALPDLMDIKNLYIFHAIGYTQGAYDPEKELKAAISSYPNKDNLKQRYHWQPYFDRIESYFQITDLLITRAGAGSVWEVASTGIPAILIPKSNLPGDHQVKNARFLEKNGSVRLIYESLGSVSARPKEENVDAKELVPLVSSILFDPDTYKKMEGKAQRMTIPDGTSRFYKILKGFQNGNQEEVIKTLTPSCLRPREDGKQNETAKLEWINQSRLLSILEKNRSQGKKLSENDRKYLKYKIDQNLNSSRWHDRNLGVKLAGLILFRQRIPALLDFINDRTKVSLYHRLLGGDFRQVGFIRRNALQALWRIGDYNPEIRKTILTALSDPYFEVRSWTGILILKLVDRIGHDPQVENLLTKNLQDRWFEVVVSSLNALGVISNDPAILSKLINLLEHKNWKVQEATIRCLMKLMERNIIGLPKNTENWMRSIQMKGLDFVPQFPLKKTWKEFQVFLKIKAEADILNPK